MYLHLKAQKRDFPCFFYPPLAPEKFRDPAPPVWQPFFPFSPSLKTKYIYMYDNIPNPKSLHAMVLIDSHLL